MSEKDFWTKYCRAEYLHKTKNSIAAAAEAADDEELAIFLKNDDLLANEIRRKVLTMYFSRKKVKGIYYMDLHNIFLYMLPRGYLHDVLGVLLYLL